MGYTPLFSAAYHGHHYVVDALIKGGADVETVDKVRVWFEGWWGWVGCGAV